MTDPDDVLRRAPIRPCPPCTGNCNQGRNCRAERQHSPVTVMAVFGLVIALSFAIAAGAHVAIKDAAEVRVWGVKE